MKHMNAQDRMTMLYEFLGSAPYWLRQRRLVLRVVALIAGLTWDRMWLHLLSH